jgi:hypothetical protein
MVFWWVSAEISCSFVSNPCSISNSPSFFLTVTMLLNIPFLCAAALIVLKERVNVKIKKLL